MNYAVYGFIALGGALGAVARYGLSNLIYNKWNYTFPLGTFVVNISGCFVLGLVFVWGTEKLMISSNLRSLIAVGFIGAFTTFSTFSLETLNIIKEGEIKIALLNMVGSVVVGLFAVWIGTVVAELLSR